MFKFELGWLLREEFFELVSKIWKKRRGAELPCRNDKTRFEV